MEYQNYEDYMRQVLGYTPHNPNIYETYDYRNEQPYDSTYYRNDMTQFQISEEEINELYPEIYHLVHPMVCKVCDTNTQPITKELVEKMTEEVYTAIGDTETVVNVRIETQKSESVPTSSNIRRTETRTERTPRRAEENRTSRIERTSRQLEENRSMRVGSIANKSEENRGTRVENIVRQSDQNREISNKASETRQIRRNSTLRDLIRILILQRLFGRNRPQRPRPPRPQFPGGPGMPPSPPTRPPFPDGRSPMGNPPPQPRDYTDYLKF